MTSASDPSASADRQIPDEAFFHALERRRTAALVDRDLPALEALHAPEYELITPGGRVFSRGEYLALFAEAPFYTAWTHGDMRVRVAVDMAVVRYRAQLTFPSGKVVDCWHTDTYERRADGWMAVWSQATACVTAG